MVGDLGHQGHRVVGVAEGAYVLAGAAGLREEAVEEERRGVLGGDVERKEALVGLGVVAAQPPDGERVNKKRLLKTLVSEVCPDLCKTVLVHGKSFLSGVHRHCRTPVADTRWQVAFGRVLVVGKH